MRSDQDRITNLDVDFSHQKGLQHAPQVGGNFVHFDHQDLGNAVSNFMKIKEVFNRVWIASHDSHNGGIGRVLRVQGENMDIVVIKKPNNFK